MTRPFTTLRGRIQKWLFNQADALILYSDRRASIVKQNIRYPGKVFVARNTLDTNELNQVYQNLLQEGKGKIKNDLGFKARFNLVFIGRLLPYKGLDDLLEAFAMLPEDPGTELHIIGDGPELNKHLIKKGNDPRIKFYGSISDLNLTGKFLYSSDLMVMPGSVGLSVVHAFAFGCPVITYERLAGKGPGHGPEVEYIRDHVNGIFCEASPASLANTLAELLSTTSKIAAMSEKALETVQHEASIEQMMDGFHNMILYLNLSKKD
jgi:glycosyltransferase involved in cell wall biosynthesis